MKRYPMQGRLGDWLLVAVPLAAAALINWVVR